MGIFKGLFRTRDAPQNRTAGSSYSFFMGGSASGKQVNERTSMQMTAVYSCVRILSEAVASLPLNVFRYTGNGGKEKAIDHSLYRLLHDEPNPEMSSFIFRETLMTHLLLWGNAYAQIIRNGKGEVIALYPLMPDRMTVDRDSNGRLYYKYRKSNDDAPTMENGSVILAPSDVLHVPGLGFDGLVGYSPIAMAKNAIGLAIAAEEYGSKFYANGAAPSGVLEHPGTLKDPARVRDSWNSTFGGSSNSHKVAVLEEGISVMSICVLARLPRSMTKEKEEYYMRTWQKSLPMKKLHEELGLYSGVWSTQMDRYWESSDGYTVSSRQIRTSIGTVEHLAIERIGGGDIPWAVKQEIKNELFGSRSVAIEVFPAKKNLVDVTDVYHLWVLPKDYQLPFGIHPTRDPQGTPVQRGYDFNVDDVLAWNNSPDRQQVYK